MTTRIAARFVLLAAVLLAACANRTVETRILDVSGVEVFLRPGLKLRVEGSVVRRPREAECGARSDEGQGAGTRRRTAADQQQWQPAFLGGL